MGIYESRAQEKAERDPMTRTARIVYGIVCVLLAMAALGWRWKV